LLRKLSRNNTVEICKHLQMVYDHVVVIVVPGYCAIRYHMLLWVYVCNI